MDTRFWGPSGWRLLHLISFSDRANTNCTFWKSLPFVLPCKFCRYSLTTYYEQHPIPTKQEEFPLWLYKIHNLVNQKLRDQGAHVEPDPPFEEVQTLYTNLLEQGCTRTEFPGWNFVFSIADNHPNSAPSKPMPDTPTPPPKSLEERNKYNLLTPKERLQQIQKFWKTLPDMLPFEEWRTLWKKSAGPMAKALKHRKSTLCWLYRIRCAVDSALEKMSKQNFYGLCKEVASHRSGCSTSSRAKTCRRIPTRLQNGGRKTRRKN